MISLTLPRSFVNSHAVIWGSTKIEFVLPEEVVEWLEDNDIVLGLTYIGGRCEDDWYEYTAHFAISEHAVIFKMRWF